MIVTITGPSCAGKTTVERELQALGWGRAISHTTRSPRQGEIDGDQYHFVDLEKFNDLAGAGQFVEAITFSGNHYAISRSSLQVALDQAAFTVVVVDPHGAEQIRNFCETNKISTLSVWIDCGAQEQAARWAKRYSSEPSETIRQAHVERLAMMLSEEVEWGRFWYRYDFSAHPGSGGGESPSALANRIVSAAANKAKAF